MTPKQLKISTLGGLATLLAIFLFAAQSQPVAADTTPILNLNLVSIQSYYPGFYHVWRVDNPNAFAVDYTWQIAGGSGGSGTATPGQSFFIAPATSTGGQTVTLRWFDEHGIEKSSTKASQTAPKALPEVLTVSVSCDPDTGDGMWTLTNPNNDYNGYVPTSWTFSGDNSSGFIEFFTGIETLVFTANDGDTLTITWPNAVGGEDFEAQATFEARLCAAPATNLVIYIPLVMVAP